MQLEMLKIISKRILFICTRLYKKQNNLHTLENVKLDLTIDFLSNVGQNFRKLHDFAGYTDLLNKSPKTISNVFKKVTRNSPLNSIHDRIMVEARNLLAYSNLEISQIGYELCFQNVQSFSRLFIRHQKVPPTVYRNAFY